MNLAKAQAERKALEFAHMKFGVEVEWKHRHEEQWKNRQPILIGTEFASAAMYRIKEVEVTNQ